MGTASDMLTEARKSLGLSGRPNYITREYASRHGSEFLSAPWCQMAVTYWARHSGNATAVLLGGDRAYTVWAAGDFHGQGRWYPGTAANVNRAKPGDVVFFDWGNSDSIEAIDHVGIVEVVLGDGRLQTIEGNTGDACLRRVRSHIDIAGYGRPAYAANEEADVPIYGVDVASYQGKPDWRKVYNSGIRFAFSKVTEGSSYVNPTWIYNRAGMAALGKEFLPGAYHFLRGDSDPAAQARHFLSKAGDVSGLAVALDVEAHGAKGTHARAWVAEFKRLTGGHPVIGYYPRWYWEQTGRPDLSFFDSIWQSHYVSGTGSASSLYAKAPSSWWEPFGGEPISILQYSSSASVPGIDGRCDVNAFRGTLDQLRALALGTKEDDVSAEDVWKADIIPAPPWVAEEGNENWTPASYLHWQYRNLANANAKLDALLKTSGTPVDVDESAIVAGVLAGLSPAAIAQAVVGALPAELAGQVVDELKTRLEA